MLGYTEWRALKNYGDSRLHEITTRWSRMQLLGIEETGNNEFKSRFPLILTSRNGGGEREKENGESRKKRGYRIPRRKITLRLRPT